MPAAVKRRSKPNVDDRQRVGFADHPLAERQTVRVVVGAAKAGRFEIPGDRAPHAVDAVRQDHLTVA